jgi:NADPH2:quinone reductase
MRAVLVREFGPIGNAVLAEVPDPVAGPGEVLLEIRAAALNYADLLVIAGQYQSRPDLPFIPGKGAAGVIAATGAGVAGFAVGDRVHAWIEEGAWAERVAAPAALCRKLPATMPFVDAAAMALDYATAWFALKERARCRAGESVLVLGATGAVGFAAVQLARAFGLKVLAGVASAAKRDLAAGADAILDLSRPDLRDSLRAQVFAANDGKGVDIVLDPVGGAAFEAAIRALAWRGRLVVIGFAGGAIPSIRANYLLVKNIEVSGLQVSDYKKYAPGEVDRCFAELFALYAEGKVRPLVEECLPLAGFGNGLAKIRDRSVRRKIVLTPPG